MPGKGGEAGLYLTYALAEWGCRWYDVDANPQIVGVADTGAFETSAPA